MTISLAISGYDASIDPGGHIETLTHIEAVPCGYQVATRIDGELNVVHCETLDVAVSAALGANGGELWAVQVVQADGATSTLDHRVLTGHGLVRDVILEHCAAA